MAPTPDSPASPAPLPRWMRLSGAGLTALVAVLFVVLLQQVRQQGQRIQTLQEKVQSLENSNDLERTNALEEQLRSTVTRLQNLEGLEQSVQRLSLEQASLRAQVRRPLPEPDLGLETPPEPPSKAGRPSPGRLPALPQLPTAP